MKLLNKNKQSQIFKLNNFGFTHHILLPVIVITLIAFVGVRVILASNAASSLFGTCIVTPKLVSVAPGQNSIITVTVTNTGVSSFIPDNTMKITTAQYQGSSLTTSSSPLGKNLTAPIQPGKSITFHDNIKMPPSDTKIVLSYISSSPAFSCSTNIIAGPSVPTLLTMKLGFDDEFTGTAGSQPNTNKWQFSDTGSNMYDYASGALIDTTLPKLTGVGTLDLPGIFRGGDPTKSANYSMGEINTKNHYSVNPIAGNRVYVEWRAKLPKIGAGVWPSAWSLSAKGSPNYDELDTFEQGTGIGPTPPYNVYSTYWTNTIAKIPGGTGTAPGRPDLTLGYHTYSMLWTTTGVTSYIDGIAVGNGTVPFANTNPVNLIADLQIGNPGGGIPDGIGWPRHYYIDYIRTFRDN